MTYVSVYSFGRSHKGFDIILMCGNMYVDENFEVMILFFYSVNMRSKYLDSFVFVCIVTYVTF